MDVVFGIILTIGALVATVFNYYLNRAPGSDPEDFQFGPDELGLRCDCYLNTLIISAIAVIAIAAVSSSFDSTLQLIVVGALIFVLVTIAGLIGRHHRYRDWNELSYVLKRAVPTVIDRPTGSIDFEFDEDDDDLSS